MRDNLELTAETGTDIAEMVRDANRPTSRWQQLSRAANVLRYYRKSQLARRFLRLVTPTGRRRYIQDVGEALTLNMPALDRLRGVVATRSVRSSLPADGLLGGLSARKFTLLNQARDLGTPVDWRGDRHPHPSRLWSFQLHYHDYLLDLAVAPETIERGPWPIIWDIVTDWIDGNPATGSTVDDDAWHPYCISRRLPVWAQLLAADSPSEAVAKSVTDSMAVQAEALCGHLEFDLGGNHLLENLHALVVAAALLKGDSATRWLHLVRRHLPRQLSQQVLAYGEHYERTPMYHCQVLGNLLTDAILLNDIDSSLASSCRKYAGQMSSFLARLLHPDGEIPLFGDSCFGESYAAAELMQLMDLAEVDRTPVSNLGSTVVGQYWVWRHNDDAVIFDAGPVGADSLPAHAHCDLLNFEASIDGQRWIVDSGLFDYDDNTMRAYCRSSAAHNVTTVGLRNSCDVWSRFRMGRRGRPVKFDSGHDDDFSWCYASHDGYRHLGISELARLFIAHPSGVWTCLDSASGASPAPLFGRLHLGPDVQVLEVSVDRILLVLGNTQRWLLPTSAVMLKVSDGWYCDRFGVRRRIPVVGYRPVRDAAPGRWFGWSLSPTSDTQVSVASATDGRCEVRIAGSALPTVFSQQFPK
ncbi:MAG: alginate lyase family protein [Planctomycetota bacterium]